jgi:hypothetical protein
MAIPLRDQNNDRQFEPANILLKREVPIDREKDVERRLSQPKKLTVPLAGPAHFGNCKGIVPDQVALQTLRQTLIKQDSHDRATRPWPVQVRLWLAPD